MAARRGPSLAVPKKDKKGLEGNDGFQKGGFRHTRTKAEERIKKEKAKKEPILNPDSQPQKHPTKKDKARPGNQTIGLPVIGLVIPGLKMLGGSVHKVLNCTDGGNPIESRQPSNTCCSGSCLHTVDWIKNGNRKIQEACMVLWHYDGILPL